MNNQKAPTTIQKVTRVTPPPTDGEETLLLVVDDGKIDETASTSPEPTGLSGFGDQDGLETKVVVLEKKANVTEISQQATEPKGAEKTSQNTN